MLPDIAPSGLIVPYLAVVLNEATLGISLFICIIMLYIIQTKTNVFVRRMLAGNNKNAQSG